MILVPNVYKYLTIVCDYMNNFTVNNHNYQGQFRDLKKNNIDIGGGSTFVAGSWEVSLVRM